MNVRRCFRPRSASYRRWLQKGKRAFLVGLFSFLASAMLLKSDKALALSLSGLNLWFQKMIPTLLPFMILSGLLIRMDLSDRFASFFAPLLRPLFRLSDSCLYVLVIGFLCGFPMGARAAAESLLNGKLSQREAALMLAFCNNIGPVYFTGFVLPLFAIRTPLPFLAGMYLLPLLYGLLLRYTLFRDIPSPSALPNKNGQMPRGSFPQNACPKACHRAAFIRRREASGSDTAAFRQRREAANVHAASLPEASPQKGGNSQGPFLMEELQASILSGLSAIASLGGYMILFNLMNLVPDLLLPPGCGLLHSCAGCLLEITSGLSRLASKDAFLGFVLLPFGGLSCIAQTYSMIRETGLSLSNYVLHKCALTLLTLCYYAILWPAIAV